MMKLTGFFQRCWPSPRISQVSLRACPTGHPSLPALFDPCIPNNPALWAVLDRRYTGDALVDDLEHPAQCVLRTAAVLTYASERVSQEFLAAALAHFQSSGEIWLVWPLEKPIHIIPPGYTRACHRLEFFDCDLTSPVLTGLRQALPPGCEIRTIDRPLLERCEWRSEMEFYCGSRENFLVHGTGLCLMREGEIITEAYVSSFGDTQAEIGAVTHAAHRGRGFAPIACAYLIQECARRGYAPYWSCDVGNGASIRVAQKLGFRQSRPYQIFEYSSNVV